MFNIIIKELIIPFLQNILILMRYVFLFSPFSFLFNCIIFYMICSFHFIYSCLNTSLCIFECAYQQHSKNNDNNTIDWNWKNYFNRFTQRTWKNENLRNDRTIRWPNSILEATLDRLFGNSHDASLMPIGFVYRSGNVKGPRWV